MSELDDLSRLKQVTFNDAHVAETEGRENCENALHVFRRRSDQEVDVTGEPRMPMKRYGVAAETMYSTL